MTARSVRFAGFVAMLLAWWPAMAQLPQTSRIDINNPWVRSGIVGGMSAAYCTLTVRDADDRLLSVSSPVAEQASLHETSDDHGVSRMRSVEPMSFAAGSTVVMKPGGTHVMLMRLKRALGENEKVPVTFTFEKAGPVTFYFPVAKVAPLPPMAPPMDHMEHKHGG